ncbi:sensor histidine kinase, partial [Thiolapillus sp.]
MPGSLECMYLALLAIIIVSGGAITVLSYQFSLLIVFESLLFAGVVSRLLWLNDVYTAPLIGLSLLFYGFMLVGGYLVGKNFSQGMRLRMMAENNQYELQRARDEAMAASRIKGEILATLGHEIKTPVNGVLGMADLLLDSSLDTRQKHLVNAIRCSSEALLGVIDHVLDYSSIESGKLELREELFNPRQLLEDVVDMMRIPARDKQLRLTANLA